MDELLPSDLCKICHTNPNKYCCPRCSTRTCSLSCAQRHKQWAQCNGVRDPAAYIKRGDLATPRAIDHDYNFLTSIERNIDRAERDVTERGVVLQDGQRHGWKGKGLSGPVKGEIRAKAALNECGVIVRKAPAGMTRAKQNSTGWSQKKRTLVWTVEWIHNNGRSELGSCLASRPLEDAYASHVSPRPAKRKRDSASPPPSAPSNPILPPSPRPSHPDMPPPPHPANPPLHFYLLRPGTPTGTRVLIPLEPTATLSTALRHRIVLEFPTLYALRYPPANLPTGFITETQYETQGQRSGQEALLGMAEAGWEAWDGGTGGGESVDAVAGNDGDVDGRKLAEVLARDMGA